MDASMTNGTDIL